MSYDLVAGDRSKLVATCLDRATSAPLNLSGKTLELRYRIDNGALQTKPMTITDAANGKAEYQFAAADLTAGTLTGEIRIQPGLSDQVTSLAPFHLSVRAPLA